MFVINYLSLNTKAGYKDFRSFWFLIDRAVCNFPYSYHTPDNPCTLNHGGPLQLSIFQASKWLSGVKISLKYNVFTGLKPNLLLLNLCNSIFCIKFKYLINCIFRICIAKSMTIFCICTFYFNSEATKNIS